MTLPSQVDVGLPRQKLAVVRVNTVRRIRVEFKCLRCWVFSFSSGAKACFHSCGFYWEVLYLPRLYLPRVCACVCVLVCVYDWFLHLKTSGLLRPRHRLRRRWRHERSKTGRAMTFSALHLGTDLVNPDFRHGGRSGAMNQIIIALVS